MKGVERDWWQFDRLHILKTNKGFHFEITDEEDYYVLVFSHADLKIPRFSTFDMCFRAARKWMRDNQNLIYGN